MLALLLSLWAFGVEGGVSSARAPSHPEPLQVTCHTLGCSDGVTVQFDEATPRAHLIQFDFEGRHLVCKITAEKDRAGSDCGVPSDEPRFPDVLRSERGFTITLHATPKKLRATIYTRGERKQVVHRVVKYRDVFPNGRRCGGACQEGSTETIPIVPASRP